MKSILWQPITINTMQLRNRFVMPPMVTSYGEPDGTPGERSRRYYVRRAEGGVGLVIVEATMVQRRGHTFPNHLAISEDRYIPAWRRLADAVHEHGAKIGVQIHHGGRMAKTSLMGMPPVAPSPIPAPGGDMPQELTLAEITELVSAFAAAAVRAKEAGLDGVEIHAAHGYLIHQFLSRSSNQRADEYGGDIASRSRFFLEVIRAVRQAVGKDYPVWCRISAQEYGVENGTTLEESQETIRMARKEGVDAVHVSASGPTTPQNYPSPRYIPGILTHLAEGIKI